MTLTVRCTRGFGKVEHPETGEEIDVQEPFETDRATFELLDEHYPGMEIVTDSNDSEPGQTDHPTNEDGEPLCVGMDDGQCSRVVDEPNSVCWQHS